MQQLDGLGHGGNRGGHERGEAGQRHVMLYHGIRHGLRVDVAPEVHHVVAVVLQQHAHDVLANVVDVALHGCQHDLALRRHGPALRRGLAQHREARLGGLGRGHQLRQEEGAPLEAVAHLVKRGNQHLVDGVHHVVGGVAVVKQRPHLVGNRLLAAGQHQVADAPLARAVLPRGCGRLRIGRLRGKAARAGGDGLQRRRHGGKRRGDAAGAGQVVGCRAGGRGYGAVLAVRIPRDVVLGALVLARERAPRPDHVHQALVHGVDDGKVKPRAKAGREERGVDQRAERHAKADVGHAKHRAHALQLGLDHADGVHDLPGLGLVGRGGHGKAVDDHVLPRNPDGVGGGHDLARHGKAPLGRGRDAILVKREAHDGAAVVLGDGQHRLQHLALAVAGVDEGLAGIAAHRPLDGHGVGGVYLQRQRGHAGQLAGQAHQRGRLVYLGQARVDVQDLGAGLGLADGLAQHVVVVAGAQGLLQALLARWVDALADHAHLAHGQRHQLLRTGHRKVAVERAPGWRAVYQQVLLLCDELGGGAAAPADDADAGAHHAPHGLAVLEGLDGVVRPALVHVRQAGVGLRHHGAACPWQHALDQRGDVGRTQAAVDAQHVGAQGTERDRGHLGGGAQEGTAVLVKGHGHEGRQVGVLLHGKQGCLGLGDVSHGLDDKEVGPRGVSRLDLLGKELVGILKRQGAHGLQQRAGGADVGCHIARARGACAANRRSEDLLDRGVFAQLGGVGAKGVGGNHLRPGSHVGRMDLRDLVGIGQAQQLGHLARR